MRADRLPAVSITHAFVRYQDAIDRARPADAFLSLWQILDTVAYPDSVDNPATEYSIEIVSKRIRSLFGDERTKELIDYCRRLRNRLVHSGEFEGDSGDVEFLKAIVESALERLSVIEPACPTSESIATYFENIGSPSDVVGFRADALEEVLRHHRRKK